MRKILFLLTLIILCAFNLLTYASDKNEKYNKLINNAEIVTLQEMETRLQKEVGDILYLRIDDETIMVLPNISKDRSLRKQIIVTADNSKMLRLFTNNEATFKQMSKMLRDYEANEYDFGGYRIITDTDNPKTLTDNITVYRFWFMKLSKEKHQNRFPIDIGIGIGGGRHHRGPWIGIGL